MDKALNQKTSNSETFSNPIKVMIITIISLICFVEAFSTDCFVPALPAIAKHFEIQAGTAQLAIPIYFMGYFALLFYGVLSDHYGRKNILLASSLIFSLGGILCVFSENYILFLAGRFLQGMGICSVAMSRAIFCDIFSHKQLKSVYSFLKGLLIFVGSLAPLAGGYLKHYFGWRSIFAVILCLGVFLFLVILFKYPETLLKQGRNSGITFKSFFVKISALLKNVTFMISVSCNMMCYAALYIIFAISPFLFQNMLGWSTIAYSYLAFSVPVMLALGAMANNLLLKKFSEATIIKSAMSVGILLSIILILNSMVAGSSFIVVLSILGFSFMCGIVMPNTFLLALKFIDKDNNAGVSFTTFSFIRIMGAGIIVFCVSFLHSQAAIIIGILLFFISLCIIILLLILKQLLKNR